jgi:hypothetical protein
LKKILSPFKARSSTRTKIGIKDFGGRNFRFCETAWHYEKKIYILPTFLMQSLLCYIHAFELLKSKKSRLRKITLTY